MTNEQMEIQRLEALLEERKNEYTIFGKTAADAQEDQKILTRIKKLRDL